uniref:(northern house mosquito) hypothetical protein n=1 Tax=Culex pipiens TaxID=7175 RepID=A0A8D8JVK9_CULPI
MLLFGVRLRLLLHIDQIRTAACPGTARVAAVRIVVVVDATTAAAGNAGHLQNALRPTDVGGAVGSDHVQTAVAPVQVSNHFLHHGAVHLPAGIDLLELPLQRFHLRLQYHRFHGRVHAGHGRSRRSTTSACQPQSQAAGQAAAAGTASTVASVTSVAVHQAVDSVPAIGGQIHQTAILLDEILAFLS